MIMSSIDSAPLLSTMNFLQLLVISSLLCLISIPSIETQSTACTCRLVESGMIMICENVHSLLDYQRCVHDLLTMQSDLKLRRGGIITNLTIRHHRLQTLSNGLLQFSYANILYQLVDLRYLYVVHGTLKQIDNRALGLIEQALEYIDLSHNQLQQMPRVSENQEQYNNLVKLILSHNEIRHLTMADIRPYYKLQQLDVSFNQLESIDMSIVHHLIHLKRLYLNSNLLRTLNQNITFPSAFHFKVSSNPLECDCRLRWLRNGLNRVEYPISHDDPKCEMPKALSEKSIVLLRDEQFVCGPFISKPDLNVLTVTSGELTTLRCDVYSDPAPDVWWTFQNKIIGKMISIVNQPDIHAGSYTIRYSCLYPTVDTTSNNCLNKTTTLTISDISAEHNGTYNCVAAIRNQGRSDNEYLSYELRVRRTSALVDSSFLLWTVGAVILFFLFVLLLLCFCWMVRCQHSNQEQTERNKALLFDGYNHHSGSMLASGNFYADKADEANCFVASGTYDPYDMLDSRSQLGPPMYSEVRVVDSTPMRSVGSSSISSTLLRRQNHPNDLFYDSYRSDRQLYEQVYRPSPMTPVVIDEFEDEMIFPTGYEENYEYREDIIKPNQAIDPRRQPRIPPPTNHDRLDQTSNNYFSSTQNNNVDRSSERRFIPNSNQSHTHQNFSPSGFDTNYTFERSESQYAGLVESQL